MNITRLRDVLSGGNGRHDGCTAHYQLVPPPRHSRWGIISANIIPTYSVASHWDIYSKTCADAGQAASGDNWRVARNVMVAATDGEARDRVFGDGASNQYFFSYMRQVLGSIGLLSVLKPIADMPDDEVTVEAIVEACVIYGSPKTVVGKLIAFRERVLGHLVHCA